MTSLEYYIEQIEQFISALTDDIESGDGTVVTQTKLAVYQEVLEHLEEIEQQRSYNSIKTELNGDLISRQAVLDLIADYDLSMGQVVKGIHALPPVTPQQKTGHWIDHPKGIYAHLICTKCLSNAPYDCRTNYCPNCGAMMIEPQEREG